MKRIIYFENNTFVLKEDVKKAVKIIEQGCEKDTNLNDKFEFIHACKLISSMHISSFENYLEMNKEVFLKYLKKVNYKVINSIKEINVDDYLCEYELIDSFYKNDYIDYLFFHDLTLKELENIKKKAIPLHIILKNKNCVKNYGFWVRDLMLINKLDSGHACLTTLLKRKGEYYIPKELTIEDMDSLLTYYVENAELREYNTLQLLCVAKRFNLGGGKYDIPLSIRKNAQVKVNEIWNKVPRNEKNEISFLHTVIIEDREGEILEIHNEICKQEVNTIYSIRKASVLNNTELIKFLNSLILYKGVLRISDNTPKTIMSSLFGFENNDKFYNVEEIQKWNIQILIDVIFAINDFLEQEGKNIENVLEEYLENVFKEVKSIDDTSWMNLNMTNNSDDYQGRAVKIANIIEDVLARYNKIAKFEELDEDIYAMESPGLLFEIYKSCNKIKNIYLNTERENDEYNLLSKMLFSSNSGLMNYFKQELIEKYAGQNMTSLDFFRKEGLSRNDIQESFKEFAEKIINDLIQLDFIIEINGELRIYNSYELNLYKYLYKEGVINWGYLNYEGKEIVNMLLSDEIIKVDNNLFNVQEINFLNYMLNNSKFDNSKALRNTYGHGRKTSKKFNEDAKRDYYILLSLLVGILLKIVDDYFIYIVNN